ncbi:MAG: alpha-amylase/4-alpha-glucanotransferase domain-containing protein, partial [Candidatus Acidiferrales bacterium]
VSFSSSASMDWQAEKHVSLRRMPGGFEIVCDLKLRRIAPGEASVNLGIETIVNFLAPDAPDRYFESAGERFPLRWSSSAPAPVLRIVDEWQKVAITIEAPGTREFWVAPIETVSESEDGFERIYQGSQILAFWPVEISSGAEWTGQFSMRIPRAS